MTFFASWVMSQNDHGYEAGRYVAHYARAAFQDAAPSLFIATVSDGYHRPAECIQGIRSVAGNIPLIGCSSRGGIPTPAGFVQKGVSVLALRLATAPVLALERGFSHAPAVTVNRTAERVQASMSPHQKQQTTALVLLFTAGSRGSTGDDTFNNAIAATGALLQPHGGSMVGATVGNGLIFVQDDVVEDGVAMGIINVAAGVGVQASPDKHCDRTSVAQQATAALGELSPAAALVIGSSPTIFVSPQDAAPNQSLSHQLAAVIGKKTPIMGIVAAEVLGGTVGTAGAGDHGALHHNALLICTLGG